METISSIGLLVVLVLGIMGTLLFLVKAIRGQAISSELVVWVSLFWGLVAYRIIRILTGDY